MLMLPTDLTQKFNDLLIRKLFPDNEKSLYLKWLRFYWDFCAKYHYDPYNTESLPLFLHKLQDKRQSEQQQKQARHAITLFYRMQYNPASFTSTASSSAYTLPADNRNQSASLTIPAVKTMEAGTGYAAKPLIQENRGSPDSCRSTE